MIEGTNSEKLLMINSDELLDRCSNWSSVLSSSNLGSINVNNTFNSFISCGIGTNFFSSLEKTINKVDSLTFNLASSINKAINEQIEEDNLSAKTASDNKYGIDLTNNGSDAVGALSSVDIGSYDVDNRNIDLNINKENNQSININNSDDNLIKLLLKSIVTNNILNIANLDNETSIKEKLLTSIDVDEEVKDYIFLMNENVLKTKLSNLITSGDVISDFSKEIISEYDNSLKDISKYYSYLLNNDNYQEELIDLYYGEYNLDNNVRDFTKKYINLFAEQRNINVGTLLTDKNYKPLIKDMLEELNKSIGVEV